MSPTSRNTLMIGGALILVALLLVCGPLSDRLGRGGKPVGEPPSVAAGPPLDEVDTAVALESVAAADLAAASIAETDLAVTDDVKVVDDSVVVADAGMEDRDEGRLTTVGLAAGAVAAGAAAGVGSAGHSGTGDGGAVLPSVSAGVPTEATMELAAGEIFSVPAAVVASEVFDDSWISVMESSDGPGPAGRVVERFAPPVAAPGGSPLVLAAAAQPFGIDRGRLRLPCDSPGSGCQNLSPSGGAGGGVVRPFRPGSPRGPRNP